MSETQLPVGVLDKLIAEGGDLKNPEKRLFVAEPVYKYRNPFYVDGVLTYPTPKAHLRPRRIEDVIIAVAPLEPVDPEDVEQQNLLLRSLTDQPPVDVYSFTLDELDFSKAPEKNGSYIQFGHLEFLEDIGYVDFVYSGSLVLPEQALASRVERSKLPQQIESRVKIPATRKIILHLFPDRNMAYHYAQYVDQPATLEGKPSLAELFQSIKREWRVPLRSVQDFHQAFTLV